MTEYFPLILQGISFECGFLLVSITGLRLGSYEVTVSQTLLPSLLELVVVLSPLVIIRLFKEFITVVVYQFY